MAPILPRVEPTTVTAGSTWTWLLSSGTYPVSEGWTLSYALNGVSRLTWSSAWLAADGETVTIPATTTATIAAGTYELTRIWTGSGTYAGRRDTEACPALQVLPDPATVVAGERVSFVEANLQAVEAAITARVAGDQPQEYTIGNRSVVKMTLGELLALRAKLRAELWALRNPGQRPALRVRFAPVGA